jgi:hypothetical protein
MSPLQIVERLYSESDLILRLDFKIIIGMINRLSDLDFVRETLLIYSVWILNRYWLPFDDPFVSLGGDPHQDRVTPPITPWSCHDHEYHLLYVIKNNRPNRRFLNTLCLQLTDTLYVLLDWPRRPVRDTVVSWVKVTNTVYRKPRSVTHVLRPVS